MPNDRKLRKNKRRADRKRKKAERAKGRHTMKRIKIPADIPIKNMDGNIKDHSFKKFLTTGIESNETYGKGLANIRRGMTLMKIVEEGCKGDELILEDKVYEDIKESIGSAQWLPPIIFQMGPFLDAIEKAETFEVKKAPKEEPKDPEKGKPESDEAAAEKEDAPKA